MTLEEVKNFLKVDFDDDDSLITLEIAAAEEYIADAAWSVQRKFCTNETSFVKYCFYLI